jgi:8-oxo-dGTP pyrophosphatase MutT (NUDIX family)
VTAGADVPVRDAATVVLLRDGTDGIEAWMLTRVRQMVFAGGMTVFPGGRVDDGDADLPMTPTDFRSLATRFGCEEHLARALIGAAVRETFEETGVLLTVPPPSVDLTRARTEVESGRVGFDRLLREHDLVVDADALRPWARWVTPVGEVRRYDTRFFVGALPDGAEAADVTTESSAASWIGLGAALVLAQRGERTMLPPTVMTLASLAEYDSVTDALAAADIRSLEPIHPALAVLENGELGVWIPGGEQFALPKSMLPPQPGS